jgi:hypothetical protein
MAIHYAEVTQRAEERPPRFFAPVNPKILDVLFDAPPAWWIFERLAAGDAEMAERVTTALVGVKKDARQLAGYWAYAFAENEHHPPVASLLGRITGGKAPIGKHLAKEVAGYREDAQRMRQLREQGEELIGRLPPDDMPDPEDDAFRAGTTRDHALDQQDPDVLAIDPHRAVREYRGASRLLLERNPKALPEVVMSLEMTIADTTSLPLYDRLLRLEELAAAHHESAVALVKRTTDPDLEPYRRFVEPGSLRAYVQRLGLATSVPTYGLALAPYLTVETFDRETDEYPNHHERRARDVAKHVGAALDGVMFDEVPHLEDEYVDEDDPDDVARCSAELARLAALHASDRPNRETYRIRAYDHGTCYETTGGDTSDWLDVDAIVGLVNVVLRARGARERCIVLLDDTQCARIFAGIELAIERASADGVLR